MIRYALVFYTITSLSTIAVAKDNEWKGFDYRQAGITSAELMLVKKNGMSRKKLIELLEYGIMPNEYFSEPWKRLGVSKSAWLTAKKQGMEDMEIDRSVYTSTNANFIPLISFVLPGFYAYKSGRYKYGGLMTGIFMSSITLAIIHQEKNEIGGHTKKKIRIIYPLIAFCTMIWSASDAFIGTRTSHNPGTSRFSFDLTPSGEPIINWSFNF